MKQVDSFPTSEPELKGHLLALTVLIGNLFDTLIKNGCLTKEQADNICYHSAQRTTYIITDNLKDDMPQSDLKRVEQAATRVLVRLSEEIETLP
jgi:hypothetical protein